jgi:hypothetical protein
MDSTIAHPDENNENTTLHRINTHTAMALSSWDANHEYIGVKAMVDNDIRPPVITELF